MLSLDDRRHLVDEVLGAAVNHLDAPGELGVFARTAVEIDEYFPSDPGILAALLLNRFSLEPGQALALPPGVMHSYLRGTCIEVMANSDNVLRGGLTGKHIRRRRSPARCRLQPGPGDVLLPSGSDGTYIYPTSFRGVRTVAAATHRRGHPPGPTRGFGQDLPGRLGIVRTDR